VRKGELSKALAQINRALAYAPGHRGAEAVLATISSRRRWAKTAAVVATLCLAGGAAAGVRALVRRQPPAAPVVAAPAPSPAPSAPPLAREAAPPPAAALAPAPSTPPASDDKATAARKHVKHAGAARPPATIAAPQPAPPPAPVVVPAPPPPVAARPALAPTAGITLRARQGFCSPSLDDRAPALRPIYEGVSVGRHDVYCTLPGGPRVLAGTYELRAGTHPDLIVLPGPDGRPTLGRPQ